MEVRCFLASLYGSRDSGVCTNVWRMRHLFVAIFFSIVCSLCDYSVQGSPNFP
ncbi:hypothetical protein SAMN06265370_10998 [Puniceibacterium sediminis]|uniref:Uncharacterized protein n=1 Tax=Puniceibacterium sediminis TaxID=1608407 RepID=A0A238X5B8_9RHOB|nr:hypothetical protein SAMN06265370_10998 [Puniceibacterium sediminis]